MKLRTVLMGTFVLVGLQACALFSKGDVTTRRYFSPDLPASTTSAPKHPELELRLGRVGSNRTISERIMFRDSEHEVGFYDDRVWTERPEAYLHRGLTRVLFEELGLRSIVGGPGKTLDVELLKFEEVKSPSHVARVRIAFSLSDERTVSLQQTLQFDRPIPNGGGLELQGPVVAAAMGEALRDAVAELSRQVIAELTQ